ncbi:MAG: hypothetical protein AAGA56_19265 [Myxococcota bacterium]
MMRVHSVLALVAFTALSAGCDGCKPEEVEKCFAKCDKLGERKNFCEGEDAAICKKDLDRMQKNCEKECDLLDQALSAAEAEAEQDKEAAPKQ